MVKKVPTLPFHLRIRKREAFVGFNKKKKIKFLSLKSFLGDKYNVELFLELKVFWYRLKQLGVGSINYKKIED